MTGEYLANLEDVLDVYAQPAEAGVVRLCFDERPCQLLDQVLSPISPKPGATQKQHQEYVRNGVCNVLLAYNIDTGQRHLQVTSTKTKADYAHFMDWLVQTHYPDAPKIKLLTTKIRLSSFSRDARPMAPSDSGSSISPSPQKTQTLRLAVSAMPRACRYLRKRAW